MKMTIDMPPVSNCDITECAYNMGHNCHARAITVGDGIHPGCDTFFSNTTHTHKTKQLAGVGACKVSGCMHNTDYECGADDIIVGKDTANGIRCLTYAPT
jgi:hypothetical protein